MSIEWRGKTGGVVSEGFEPENLDTSKEFVLELIESEYLENQTVTFQGDSKQVDRFKTIWLVEGHQTKVWQWFNLPVGFLNGAAVNERSNVVGFAVRATGKQAGKGTPFRLDDYFVDHMRIRCILERQKDGNFYRMDLKTVFPYNVRPLDSAPATPEKIAGLTKLVQLYPSREEAWKTFKETIGDDAALFSLVWDKVQIDKAGPPPKKAGEVIVGS